MLRGRPPPSVARSSLPQIITIVVLDEESLQVKVESGRHFAGVKLGAAHPSLTCRHAEFGHHSSSTGRSHLTHRTALPSDALREGGPRLKFRSVV